MTGIVTRKNPIRRATCDPAGAGFDRIVEIRPDPDSRIGYLSIPRIITPKCLATKARTPRLLWGFGCEMISVTVLIELWLVTDRWTDRQPRVGPGYPLPPLLLPCPFTSSSFALYYFFPFFSHSLYLFSSIVHPIPFYQNRPTPFPGERS